MAIGLGFTIGAFVCGVIFADKVKAAFKTYVTDKVVSFLAKYLPASWF